MFNVIYLLTDGGPDLYFGEPGQTDILITYVYDVAFRMAHTVLLPHGLWSSS